MANCKEILRYLVTDRGYSLPNIERILEIPQGSFKEIINGRTPLPEEKALIQIIGKHPWMIEAFDDITSIMVKEKKKKDTPYIKETWKIIGGIELGNGLYTKIAAVCDCGYNCGEYIDCDKKGRYFKSRKECRDFIKWEQAKKRVNQLPK